MRCIGVYDTQNVFIDKAYSFPYDVLKWHHEKNVHCMHSDTVCIASDCTAAPYPHTGLSIWQEILKSTSRTYATCLENAKHTESNGITVYSMQACLGPCATEARSMYRAPLFLRYTCLDRRENSLKKSATDRVVLFYLLRWRYTYQMEYIALNDIYIQLFVSMILGMILGVERFIAHKTAGMRTYTLISLGAALLTILSQLVTVRYGMSGYDFHVIAQIITAAGFLGVGAIFRTQQGVSGITTASGMGVAAAIGIACGFSFFRLAALVTGLALFTFIVLWFIEKQIRKIPINTKNNQPL